MSNSHDSAMSNPEDSARSAAEPSATAWESCPAGTLTRAVRGIQGRRRNRRRANVVGAVGSVVIVLLAATMIAQQFGQPSSTVPQMGKITCAKVKSMLPAYLAGQLEAAVMGQVEGHLDGCPHCRERYEKAKDDTARPGQRKTEAPQLAMRT